MRGLSRFIMLVMLFMAAGCQGAPASPTPDTSPTAFPTPTISATAIRELPPETNITVAASAEPALVRIVHAAVDTPTINVYRDTSAIATNLDFGQLTEPTPLELGEHTFKVASVGAQADDPAIFETLLNVDSAALLAVVAKQDNQYRLLTFPETIQPLNPGESIITLVNAIPNTSDVTLRQGNTDITTPIGFGTSAVSNPVASGDTTLTIQAAGSAAATYDIDLEAGQHYTLILGGVTEDIRVIAFSTQSPGRATVRAIHASEALEPVDVYLNEQTLVEDATFGRPTERQVVNAGDYTVSVYEAGTDPATAQSLVSQLLSLPIGENTALLIVGEGADTSIILYAEDLSPTPPGQARIAFLNTLPNVRTLHLETSGGPLPDVPDMGFGDPPIQTYLGADTHNLYWTRVGGNDPDRTVENVENIQLEQGTSYLYLVTGRMDNQPVVLSEDVGVDENLTSEAAAQDAGEAGADAVQLRFINAIRGQTEVNFQLNDTVIASNIGFGQASELIPANQTDATIGVSEAGSGTGLQAMNEPLEPGRPYTVIAYGDSLNQVELLLVPDSELIFDGRSPHLRLINASTDPDDLIGMGFSPQDPTPGPGTPAAPLNQDLRRSIPGGIQFLADNIPGGGVSSTILMSEGIIDLEILDAVTDQLAATVTNVELTGDGHYDIIAYLEPDTTRIRALIVPYPAP